MSYSWYVNTFYSKVNNSDFIIFINKIINEYNYNLNIKVVIFRKSKRFSNEIIDVI